MSRVSTLLLSFSLMLFAASCVRVPEADDKEVASLVQERIDKQVSWHKDERVLSSIDHLLKQQLECAAAIQIALLNNPRIQASFEGLGIAQADLVQAGLFRNPIFAGFVRFPVSNDANTNTEVSITQSFMELLLMPLRKKVAQREFAKAQAQVALVVLDVAFDVEETFYALQIELEKLDVVNQQLEVQTISHTIAQRQFAAGTINTPMLQSASGDFFAVKLKVSNCLNTIAELRQRLTLLLGLRLTQVHWDIVRSLPILPQTEYEREVLEKRAFAHRLDLARSRLELKRLFEMGETKRWWSYTDPSVGVSYDKDAEGVTVLGPSFTLALPFFDHGQADRARLVASLKQGQHALVAQELQVAKEVRLAYERCGINRQRVQLLQNELLPLQQQIMATSQEYYNSMGIGVHKLLQNKQQELQVQLEYLDALQEFCQAKVALKRAVGGQL